MPLNQNEKETEERLSRSNYTLCVNACMQNLEQQSVVDTTAVNASSVTKHVICFRWQKRLWVQAK